MAKNILELTHNIILASEMGRDGRGNITTSYSQKHSTLQSNKLLECALKRLGEYQDLEIR